jgi:hypothetical protein
MVVVVANDIVSTVLVLCKDSSTEDFVVVIS